MRHNGKEVREVIADMIRSTFFSGGPGEILFQLALVAIVSYGLMAVAQATNHGNIAGYIRSVSVLVCIGMVIKKAFDILQQIITAGGR